MENIVEKTLGENRIRVGFNPSAESVVDIIKNKTAELINLVNECPSQEGETKRLMSLAMTAYEEAAMWAVKAVTGK
jgi:hypothetical protein